MRGVSRHRVIGFLTRRQYGKTTLAALLALKKMLRTPGHDVVFGSVKLDLGREIVRKESAALRKAFALLAPGIGKSVRLTAVDGKGRSVDSVTPDDWAELYETCRLELRLYHDRNTYSRTKVVALTPDAVGETGDLILDEVGRVRNFAEVYEAVKPIISSNPEFRCVFTTTPPPDDTHYSFDLLAPPLDAVFAVNPEGNWYRSDLGVWVLRVDAFDAAADGVPLYDDDTGEAITPEESRRREPDKDAWDRNYGVKFVIGGSSAIGLPELDSAQRRGVGQCRFAMVNEDGDLDDALDFMAEHIGTGPVAVGVDWASSQKEGSNPTAVTVTEGDGEHEIQRLVLTWKTASPDVQRARLRRIIMAIASRHRGGRARRLCQDATGNQLFCRDVAKYLSGLVPVENVVMSETEKLPSYDSPVSKKTLLGDRYVAQFADNRMTCPPERYFREDHRLPKKIKGLYVCDPLADGKHGDTFDSGKLASHGLRSNRGIADTKLLRVGFTSARSFFPRFRK